MNAIITELPRIVSDMQDMELIYARGRYVKYRIKRRQDINGTTSEAPAPITALWDLDIYNGANPGITLPPVPLPPMRGYLTCQPAQPPYIRNSHSFCLDTASAAP